MLKQDSTFGLSLDIKLDGFSRNAALFRGWGGTISSYLLKYTLFYDITIERFSKSFSTKRAKIVKGHTFPTLNKQTKGLGSIRYLKKIFSSSLSEEN